MRTSDPLIASATISALIASLAIITILGMLLVSKANLPTCPEDAVLVGTGQFESGRWEHYECGPAVDNYTGD